MKTQREMYEERLQRNVWLDVKDVIIICSIFLMLIFVAIWKYEIYTVSLLSAIKWFFLSIGSGFCLGSMVSYYLNFFSSEWLLERKRDRNHQRAQNCWAKKDAMKKNVEKNPNDKKAKIRLKKVEHRQEQLAVISKLLTNPYNRV